MSDDPQLVNVLSPKRSGETRSIHSHDLTSKCECQYPEQSPLCYRSTKRSQMILETAVDDAPTGSWASSSAISICACTFRILG